MTPSRASRPFFRLAPMLAVTWVLALPCAAQVATDGSLGIQRTLPGPQILVPSNLGRAAGPNLFHSFRTFNVARNETVSFTELGGIQHIIARVTGGARSEIFGRIRVDSTSANLFLLNPSGFLFGTGATLDVPAAFYASTANAVRFADGTRFSAQVADGVTLSVSAPAAFAFNGPAAPITVSGASLAARAGQTIGLVGGDIRLERGTGTGVLSAPAGAVGLIATRGAGEVSIGAQPQPTGFQQMGSVEILNGTRVSVAEGSGSNGSGRIFIRGGDIVVDHARLDASTRRGAGGGIDMAAQDGLALHGAEVIAITTGAGGAGAIGIAARRVTIDDGALIDTSCDPGCTTGTGGRLAIGASESIVISGIAPTPTYVVSNSFGGGAAGRITLSAPTIDVAGAAFVQSIALASGSSLGIGLTGGDLRLTGGAQVDASSRGDGRGGPVEVTVERLRIAGFRVDTDGSGKRLPSGLFSNAEGRGDAGTINIRADSVRILDGGEVSSSAAPRSSGRGGTINFVVSGELEVAGVDVPGASAVPSGIVTNTFSTGPAGDIVIRAGSVILRDRGLIQSQSEGAGAGGRILIAVRDLTLLSGATISSAAHATGNGGTIEVSATGTVRIEGINTGLFAETDADPLDGRRAGSGGSINIVADTIVLAGGGVLFASSKGSGDGGNISARALTRFDIGPQAGAVSESNGVDLQSGNSPGLAGDIDLRSGGELSLQGIVATRTIVADGGNIALASAGRTVVIGGRVTTAVGRGLGNGGNIRLDIPTLVLLNATVSANAFGGNGGNIHIAAPTFILSPTSKVTASSQLGIDGIIQIDSPAIDLSGALTAPPPRYLDNDSILAGRCNARLAGKSSSLAFAAREAPAHSGRTYFMAHADEGATRGELASEQCIPAPRGAPPR